MQTLLNSAQEVDARRDMVLVVDHPNVIVQRVRISAEFCGYLPLSFTLQQQIQDGTMMWGELGEDGMDGRLVSPQTQVITLFNSGYQQLEHRLGIRIAAGG